jgi:hypothetical protein
VAISSAAGRAQAGSPAPPRPARRARPATRTARSRQNSGQVAGGGGSVTASCTPAHIIFK